MHELLFISEMRASIIPLCVKWIFLNSSKQEAETAGRGLGTTETFGGWGPETTGQSCTDPPHPIKLSHSCAQGHEKQMRESRSTCLVNSFLDILRSVLQRGPRERNWLPALKSNVSAQIILNPLPVLYHHPVYLWGVEAHGMRDRDTHSFDLQVSEANLSKLSTKATFPRLTCQVWSQGQILANNLPADLGLGCPLKK